MGSSICNKKQIKTIILLFILFSRKGLIKVYLWILFKNNVIFFSSLEPSTNQSMSTPIEIDYDDIDNCIFVFIIIEKKKLVYFLHIIKHLGLYIICNNVYDNNTYN